MLSFKSYHALLMAGFQGLPAFLNKKQLSGKDSRARQRFYRDILNPRIKLLEDERMSMLLELCDKENGEPQKNEDGSFKLSEDNLKKFREDYDSMLQEDWNVDVTEANKSDLMVIKEIMADCEQIENGLHERAYNEILDELEKKLA